MGPVLVTGRQAAGRRRFVLSLDKAQPVKTIETCAMGQRVSPSVDIGFQFIILHIVSNGW